MPVITYHQTKLAMGSDITLVLSSDLPIDSINNIYKILWIKIFKFESTFSRFLYSSELSKFNRNAGLKTAVSADFRNLLLRSEEMYTKTDGLFNPFVLPALQKAGYKSSFVDKYQSDTVEDYSKRMVVPINNLIINSNSAQIPANTALDFGGIGKGYLADELSLLPELEHLQGYWLSIGGDIIASGLNENDEPWPVHIQNAIKPKENLEYFLTNQGNKISIATSGTIIRKSHENTVDSWHHIIDPSTLKPAKTDVLLATIEANNACEADIYASCAVILGTNKAKEYLKSKNIKSMLLQTKLGVNKHSVYGNFKTIANNADNLTTHKVKL